MNNYCDLDDFTVHHCTEWAEKHVSPDRMELVLSQLLRCLSDDPEYYGNRSYPEIMAIHNIQY